MLAVLAIITTSICAPDDVAEDVFARLGLPKEESHTIRIHLSEGGRWEIDASSVYRTEGVPVENLEDFEKELMTAFGEYGDLRSSSRRGIGPDRRECMIRLAGESPLAIGLLLSDVLEQNCDKFRWDRKAFEWRSGSKEVKPNTQKEAKTMTGFIAQFVTEAVITAGVVHALKGFDEELKQKNITPAEWEAASMELSKYELIVSTDGKILADAPAKLSDDGKTMTLDVWKFLSDPPKAWGIRITDLEGKHSPGR